MSEKEVVYSDVMFVKGKEKAAEPVPSPADTTYSEVKIVKTTTEPEPEPAGSSGRRSKVDTVKVVLLVLVVLLMGAVSGLVVTLFLNMKTTEGLKTKLESEIKNVTERLSKANPTPPPCPEPTTVQPGQMCHRCGDGWENHGATCYYFSTNKMRWNESRRWCRDQDGDLVQIHSREEQGFLEDKLQMKMDATEDKFWIGLTDQETEDEWMWVDGSPLDSSLSFWSGKEPDNWKDKDPDGENCARMGERGGATDLKIWFDQSCKVSQKFICEKNATGGFYRLKCV